MCYMCYIVDHQFDGALMPLFIKTAKNIFSYGMSHNDKNYTYTMSFNISEAKEWLSQYKKIWNKVKSRLFEKLVTEPIQGGDKYVQGDLKTWKEGIKTNFYSQDVPHDVFWNATAVLRIDPAYKQG